VQTTGPYVSVEEDEKRGRTGRRIVRRPGGTGNISEGGDAADVGRPVDPRPRAVDRQAIHATAWGIDAFSWADAAREDAGGALDADGAP
jgi:hypothetical protein